MTGSPLPGVLAEARSWPGVAIDTSDRGSVRALVGRIEIGHLHGELTGHLPMPPRLRDELVAKGQATPHPVFPRSGWVEYTIRRPEEHPTLVSLFRMNYDRAFARQR